jgi:hypothetical protein
VSATTTGTGDQTTMPSRTSRWSRIAEIATTEMSEVITEVSPVASRSLSASMSDVRREMIRPDV